MSNDMALSGTVSVTYLYILASIALFTLLIACINFMNLSTARSYKRSAEVGIRKVLGARKRITGTTIHRRVAADEHDSLCSALVLQKFTTGFFPRIGKNLIARLFTAMVYRSWILWLSIITGLLAEAIPRFTFVIIPARKSPEGKIYQLFIGDSIKKGAGNLSIYHRCSTHCCLYGYHEPNELFALYGPRFCKRPANSDTIKKYGSKKHIRFVKNEYQEQSPGGKT